MSKLPATFFAGNRKTLAKKGGLYVLSAYTKQQRSNDASFYFEQEANFWYLTGIDAPDWWVIIDGVRGHTWLVAPEISAVHQTFDGSLSHEDALAMSGAEEIISRDDADKLLRDLARRHSLVGSLGDDPYAKYYDFVLNPAPKELWRKLDRIFNDVRDIRQDLARQRAVKQPEEIAAMKRAIALTNATFKEVKDKLATFKNEYEIEAEFSYQFRKKGADGHAYDPIVAAGKNAVTLHYDTNSEAIKKKDLVLMDIGARVDGYAADVTRTYAVSTPTARQKAVHAAVEKAQKEIIKLIAPGVSLKNYADAVDEIMKDALESLGLLPNRDDQATYRKYFPHAISHGLGVDVHDSLGAPIDFAENMVLTVEPGIYIEEERIGVRIEDDILVTKDGSLNLSKSLPTSL